MGLFEASIAGLEQAHVWHAVCNKNKITPNVTFKVKTSRRGFYRGDVTERHVQN